MSQLYGIVSHSALCRLLRTHMSNPFCSCCATTPPICTENREKKKQRGRTRKSAAVVETKKTPWLKAKTLSEFNAELVQFLQNNHLSVYAIEKTVKIGGLCGRVDGIFRDNVNKRTLYVVDWKFSKNVPPSLPMEYVMQLNLYRYIMKRMTQYAKYDLQLYCFIFSAHNNSMRVFKSLILPDEFIWNFISKTCFEIKTKNS